MVSEGKGRLFRRKDGKDSMFPFKTNSSIKLKVSFKIGEDKLTVGKWTEVSDE